MLIILCCLQHVGFAHETGILFFFHNPVNNYVLNNEITIVLNELWSLSNVHKLKSSLRSRNISFQCRSLFCLLFVNNSRLFLLIEIP